MPAIVPGQKPVDVSLRVYLPDHVMAQYEEQADACGKRVENLISDRVLSCVAHIAEKPIYLDDDERREVEQILGKNISSPKELITLIRNCVSVKVGTVKITLQPGLLSRLKTRCLGIKWEDFLEQIVVHDLERYVGMR